MCVNSVCAMCDVVALTVQELSMECMKFKALSEQENGMYGISSFVSKI